MIYELRIYTAESGKLPALMARFRDHTVALFEKHGLKNVGYWRNSIGGRSDELWYMLAFEDMAQRDAAWAAFATDPEWQQVRAESEADARSSTTSRTASWRPRTSRRSTEGPQPRGMRGRREPIWHAARRTF